MVGPFRPCGGPRGHLWELLIPALVTVGIVAGIVALVLALVTNGRI